MGKAWKVALLASGALILGAIVFAIASSSRREPRFVGAPMTARDLDSLSEAADAPPPPPPNYSPTWISMEASAPSYGPDAGSGGSTPESEVSSTPPPGQEAEAPEPFTAADYYKPPREEPPPAASAQGTPPSPPSSSDPAANKPVDPQPNNTEELRKLLYKGK